MLERFLILKEISDITFQVSTYQIYKGFKPDYFVDVKPLFRYTCGRVSKLNTIMLLKR